MTRIVFFAVAFLFLFHFRQAVSETVSSEPFEGRMTIHMEGKGITNTFRFIMKGYRMMMKPAEEDLSTNAYPIIDFQSRRITLLSFRNKTYFSMSMDFLDKSLSNGKADVALTGKKDRICGYPVEEWLSVNHSEGLEFHAWGATGIGSTDNLMLLMQGASGEGADLARDFREILSRGQFPLKIRVLKGGQNYFDWEVTRVENCKIGDQEFDVPADFVKLSDYIRNKTKQSRGR